MANIIRIAEINEDGTIVEINENDTIVERTPVAIEMWYDRSRREWVLYPVDENGYQLDAASYGFGKKEALKIKKDLMEKYGL